MEHLEFAERFARHAGYFLKLGFFKPKSLELKRDGSLVTSLDKDVNELAIDLIKEYFPHHGVRGEEDHYEPTRDYVWVCDPIDGTRNFASGVPNFAISLALVHEGEPLVACVYDPMIDRMYLAQKGEGATLNAERIQVRNPTDSPVHIFGVAQSITHLLDSTRVNTQIIEGGHSTANLGSIVCMGMLVASGQYSGLVVPYDTAHDVAAIDLLIREAGGKTGDVLGHNQRYDRPVNGFMAATPALYDELLTYVKAGLP